MKVLFISSGKNGRISDLVKNQGDSLVKAGMIVDYLMVNSGLWNYLKSIPKIRKKVKTGKYDLVHAHYSLSAFVTSLAGNFPFVVSLMGSDVHVSGISRWAIRLFNKYKWNAIIVKTLEMKALLGIKNAHVIPNGVDLDRFKPIGKELSRKRIGLTNGQKLIIFISILNRPEKNLELAEKVIKELNDPGVEFRHIYNVPNSEIPFYLNAADILLLTSIREGSVNVVKEAMACNCPIVSTDVGDVRWIVNNTKGCYITSFNYIDITGKVKLALGYNNRTNGRERIIALGLNSNDIALKLRLVYEHVLSENRWMINK